MWTIVGHWSYSGNPSTSSTDAVRFLAGDTDDREPLCADEEVAYAIAQNTTVQGAAAAVCEAIAARFAREADTTISPQGGVSHTVSYSQRAGAYRMLAQQYRNQETTGVGSTGGVAPYCGGISRSDKDSREDDSDRVSPAFVSGMFQYAETAPSEPAWEDLDR